MKFISIKEAMKKEKGTVSVRGWVYRFRGSAKIKFLVLRDSSSNILGNIDSVGYLGPTSKLVGV